VEETRGEDVGRRLDEETGGPAETKADSALWKVDGFQTCSAPVYYAFGCEHVSCQRVGHSIPCLNANGAGKYLHLGQC
jgi:hypothetical protein